MSRLPRFPKDNDRLLVNEFFHSIQGESTHAGRSCFFVRLAGCHLRCSYCDTQYAFFEGHTATVDEVLARIRQSGERLIEITGGEPLLQRPVYILMQRLVEEGYEVLLETSGSLDAAEVPAGVKRIFDIKTPDSGESAAIRWSNFTAQALRAGDEIKFVLASRADYEWAREVVHTRLSNLHTPILFSPVWNQLEPAQLAAWIIADGLPVRLQVQLHKILWGDRRGT